MENKIRDLPPVQISYYKILHAVNVLLDLLVDSLAPLRYIGPGKVPLATASFEQDVDSVEGFLGRQSASSIKCDKVLVNTISLGMVNKQLEQTVLQTGSQVL